MPRRAQCQENQCLPPPKIKAFFSLLPAQFTQIKAFVCCIKSKQVSHKCIMSHYFVLFMLIHVIQPLCLHSGPQTHLARVIPEPSLSSVVPFIWVSQTWLCTLCCLWGKLVKVIQPTERLSHSPATEGSMSPEPGVVWTQETNSSSCLVIGDALIRWAGACWRVITRVPFNRLPPDDQPL